MTRTQTKTKSTRVNDRRWEAAEDTESAPRIDTAAGVIYNVLVLGKRSRNKRRYTEEAMEDAVRRRKYDFLQVYIGPHKKHRFAKRSPHDHAGELRNIRLAPDGIRGDLYYNRASRGGKLALEIAERFPKRFGLSHHADVAGYVEDGEKIITRILEATVADIIKDPATTDSVFEDVETPKAKPKKAVRETATEDEELDATEVDSDDVAGGGWQATLKSLIGEIHDDDDIDDDVKMKATKMVMKVKALLNGSDEDDEDDSDADTDADAPAPAEESVNVKRLINKKFDQLKRMIAAGPKRKPGVKPRSTARSGVTEDVTPQPKPAALPALKKREEIIDAYSED